MDFERLIVRRPAVFRGTGSERMLQDELFRRKISGAKAWVLPKSLLGGMILGERGSVGGGE
jgi:hypothetical protein